MRKLYKLAFIPFIPLISGIALLIIGGTIDNPTLTKVGGMILSIGMPVTLFALVVISLILMITGRLSDDHKPKKRKDADVTGAPDDTEETTPNTQYGETADEREKRILADINSTGGYASKYKLAE